MLKYLAFLAILVAVVIADDVEVSGDFQAETASLTWQTVRITNLLEGTGLVNALHDVKFTVSSESLSLVLSPLAVSPVSVGEIISGASGYGRFSVIGASSGRFTVTIDVSYRTSSVEGVVNLSKDFVMVIDDDLWLLKRDSGMKMIAPQVENKGIRSDVQNRQPGNNDANITPTIYSGVDSLQTWNSFYIHAGGPDLLNTTFSVIVTDSGGVGVTYPSDIGNVAGSIPRNTTFYTSIGFTGGPGIYTLNCSIRYRRQIQQSWKIFWMAYPLVIEGDSSSMRAAVIPKVQAHPENYYVLQSGAVVGVAVGGMALVAAVAVIAAVVIIKKKQDTISV